MGQTIFLDSNKNSSYWGNGADGAVAIGANTTLTRDMNYASLVVDAGVFWLNNANFIIRVAGDLTVGAGNAILCNGTAAGAAPNAGAAIAVGSFAASGAGGAGGATGGANAGTNGGATAVGVTDGVTNYCTGGIGGAGGTGGGAAGAAGVVTAQPGVGPTGALAGGGR